MTRSLRKELIHWVLFPVLGLIVVSLVSSTLTYVTLINRAFDIELQENAQSLSADVTQKNGQWILGKPFILNTALDTQDYEGKEKHYFLILGPQNQYIGGDRDLRPRYSIQHSPAFWNQSFDKKRIRVVMVKTPINPSTLVTIYMGETLVERDTLIQNIFLNTLMYFLLFLVLTVACVWWGVNRIFAPLDKLQNELKNRSENHLQLFEEATVPEEIVPLIRTINGLIQKIESYIQSQKRFIANAAHQLRTPLTGLQMQTELLARENVGSETGHIIEQMECSMNRATHTIEKLLTLHRFETLFSGQALLQPLNLSSLVQTISHSFAARALQKNIDFGYEGPEDPIMIQGDTAGIQELLSNLIDNALLYTPVHGQVTVRVHRQDNTVILSVEDNGPGIPADQREKIFERFYRINDANIPGSGLGLAIVKDIATSHQAIVQVVSSPDTTNGATIQVTFPFFVVKQ